MTETAGYSITEKLYEDPKKTIYRGVSKESTSKPLQVMIKVLNNEFVDLNETDILEHEYTVTKDLDIEGIVKPYELVNDGNAPALIFEDFGGEPLANLIESGRMELEQFLDFAVKISTVLEKIHGKRIIHKNITPRNILINSQTGQLKITDFEISSVMSKDGTDNPRSNMLEGTLAYMSPEQTGRMSSGVDSRSDLYSLGVVFYEMLTGELPFQAEAPLEMIHSHIAMKPVPPHEVDIRIPEAVSRIIMKLLCKTAEERYQTARGLKIDLNKCLNELNATGKIGHFEPGGDDMSPTFRISEGLYGRETETAQLKECYNEVCGGRKVIAIVSGFSGVGKTSLVRDANRSFSQNNRFFVAGKFERLQRDIPYSGFIQAFKDLIGQLLKESEDTIALWKTRILSAVGPYGRIIADIVPQVELIIGRQKPEPGFTLIESKNRFHIAFQSFVSAFAQKDHPLVIFLDDLQWADPASFQLLKILFDSTDIKHMLLMGTYRENEVDALHPLRRMLEKARESGIRICEINLKPLNKENVGLMVSDTLKCEKKDSMSLASIIHEKTEGNPFFVNEFLKTLYKDGHIYFDAIGGRWDWDTAKIKKSGITDNIAMLMTYKIRRLSDEGQSVLKLAACIGTSFTLEMLTVVNKKPAAETESELNEALTESLIQPCDESYRFAPAEGENILQVSDMSFKFLHDRVQQAAYSLLSSNQRQSLHLQIGKQMIAGKDKELVEENICEITEHLNKGASLIEDLDERQELAQLNLAAGKKAKASVAYESALSYFNAGLEMLSGNSWQNLYELTLSLHVEAAESAYMSTDFSRAEGLTNVVINKAKTVLDTVRVYEIIIQSYYAQNMFKKAIDSASKILKQLGIFLPKKTGKLPILLGMMRTRFVLQRKSTDDLYNLPKMSDPLKLAAMRILMSVTLSLYTSTRNVFPSIAFKMVVLSVKYGNSPLSPFAYTLYALILGSTGKIGPGYRYGSFALDLLHKFSSDKVDTKIYSIFFGLIKRWRNHLKESLDPLLEAYQAGLETGDLLNAAYIVRLYCHNLFFTGMELKNLEQETAKYGEVLKKLKQESPLRNVMLIRQAALNLIGKSEPKTVLIGECFNEKEMLPDLMESNDRDAIIGLHFLKALLCYIFEDFQKAHENLRKIERYHENRGQFGFGTALSLYYSLILLAVYPELNRQEQKQCIKKVSSYHKVMGKWAEHAPMNYLHKWQLVEAERARVLGEDLKAMKYYDLAINGARENGYVQEEALANELAAKFYISKERERAAAEYLKGALFCYRKWGADAKEKDMRKKYKNLLSSPYDEIKTSKEPIPLPHETANIRPEDLDLDMVLKASRVISGEILLGSLLEKMMKIVIEVSGAQKGLLILEKEGKFFIEAEGDAETGKVSLLRETEFEKSGELSHAVTNYVIRTKENIILNEAVEEELFQNDPYIIQKKPRSLLCAPIIHQGKLKGVIYLENNISRGAFTEERLEIVRHLSSQAAVSLENAILFRSAVDDIDKRKKVEEELRRSEEMARSLLDALKDSLILIEPDGTILNLNRTAARGFGKPIREVIGLCLWGLLPPDPSEHSKGSVERAVQSGRALRVVYEQQGVLEDTVICPVFDSEGHVTKIAILTRDITEQIKVKEQVKIQEKQLLRSDRLVFMGELAAGVAHEINTPNSAITLSAGYISKAYPDILSILADSCDEYDDLRIGGLEYKEFTNLFPEAVTRIKECAKRIDTIVNEMKSFVRDEPEDLMSTVDINVTVQSAVVLATPFIKKSTDNFTVQLEENLPKIRGNPQKIEQVLLNLTQNACQSLPDKSRALTIRTSWDRKKNHIILEVSDEGKGMSEDVLAKIKEPFFTTRRETGGTGLGLSISSRIIEQHRGTITFRSSPGKGTTVTVTLPVEGEV
jgi:PAS domain S-box-containing protein